jgi:hypothetical protein
MPNEEAAAVDLAEQGRALYRARLREKLESEHDGELVAIEVETGDWELAMAPADAITPLRARHPRLTFYVHRVGRDAAFRLGTAS